MKTWQLQQKPVTLQKQFAGLAGLFRHG